MDNITNQYFNTLFMKRLEEPDGLRKISTVVSDYVRTKIREDSILDKVLPAETVTPSELQNEEDNDTLYAMCEIEPEDTPALVLNLDGQPLGKVFSAPRFKVPFWLNSTRRFEKPIPELLAYKMNLRNIVQDNAIAQMITLQDAQLLAMLQAAVTATGKVVTGTAATINKADLVDLINLLDGDELEAQLLIMRKDDWNHILAWDNGDLDVGTWEVTKDGYKYNTLLGRRVIFSIKNVIDPGEIWAVTAPEFMGKHFVISDTKVEFKEEFGLLQFQAQKHFGFNLGNVNSVAKLELT